MSSVRASECGSHRLQVADRDRARPAEVIALKAATECQVKGFHSRRCRRLHEHLRVGQAREQLEERAGDIEAVDVFRGPAEVPDVYGGTAARCGVVAVWLRR